MTSREIREKYINFFVSRGHKQIPPAKLVPENDPTTLFTSSGMQPLVSYLLGQAHPEGKRLVDSQPSFRAEDIEEVGDNRHTTFFEMLGNWSLGDYFKKEQLEWFYQFLTEELKIDPERLHVTYFEGNEFIPKDEETFNKWKELGISEDKIYPYGIDRNWWSRSGLPENMPIGEIGGVDSEVFYEFPQVNHDKKFGDKCYPHCDCGHFLEIGNSVFIEYKKVGVNKFDPLPNKNVDFGGGLERLAAAVLDTPDIFQTDLYVSIIRIIEQVTGKKYEEHKKEMQVIVDHMKAAVFLIKDGVIPSNKLQGYIARRLLRRAALKSFQIDKDHSDSKFFNSLVKSVVDMHFSYFDNELAAKIEEQISLEIRKFRTTLEKGLRELNNNIVQYKKIDQAAQEASKGEIPYKGGFAFYMYESYGFPPELTLEELQKDTEIKSKIDINEYWQHFNKKLKEHQEQSRTASAGMFKGGLADHSEIVTKYHTATHLLHQALRDVLGPQVFQKGSNITSERLRFDFSFDRKMTEEEIRKVEEIINQRVKQDLKVDHMTLDLEKAKAMNAIGLFLQGRRFPSFDEKYADKVSLYGVGSGYQLDLNAKDARERGGYYSLEFCGGPHVERTGVIGQITITKEEAISSGIRRIRAEIIN